MTVRLVEEGWGMELTEGLRASGGNIRIICPFIKLGALDRLLHKPAKAIRVITRFNLADFASGVSDIAALRKLLAADADIRGIRGLHAKVYIFGTRRAIITSANLTGAALSRNREFGLVANETAVVRSCSDYFENLWRRGGDSLRSEQLGNWEAVVVKHWALGGSGISQKGLKDYGAKAGLPAPSQVTLPSAVADATQAFVKFLGDADNRVPSSCPVVEELRRSGCHWAVAYPESRRPRSVNDNDVIFIGRMTLNPSDIRIFGRAIAMKYQQGRDDATPEDIANRRWKKQWSRYIRVHQAEFVAGTMANGISLNKLVKALGVNSFASTQINLKRGKGNTNPRTAYRHQPAVRLSRQGHSSLSDQLQLAFDTHGIVPQDTLDQLDWPILSLSSGRNVPSTS